MDGIKANKTPPNTTPNDVPSARSRLLSDAANFQPTAKPILRKKSEEDFTSLEDEILGLKGNRNAAGASNLRRGSMHVPSILSKLTENAMNAKESSQPKKLEIDDLSHMNLIPAVTKPASNK
jgi:hypothetical protein